MKNLLILLTLSFALTLSACSAKSDDIVETSYKSLQTSATLGYAVLASAADLHDQGLLTDEAYTKVHDAAKSFYETYMAAVDVLYVYADTKSDTGKEKLLSYIDLLKASVNVLLTVAEGVGLDLSALGVSTEGYEVEEVPAVENAA